MKQMQPLKKSIISLLSILAIFISVFAVATPVLAYYIHSTGEINNGEYTYADHINPIIEGEGLKNISIKVEGNETNKEYPVYVRVELLFTWQMEVEGIPVVHYQPVTNKDYSLVYNSDKWVQDSVTGYYYYTDPVKSGGATDIFITSCTRSGTTPPDYCTLYVEVIVQTVQAIGITDNGALTSWQDAWGISKFPPD